MRNILLKSIGIIILIGMLSFSLEGRVVALVDSLHSKDTYLSKVDLRRYFEKAMSLFESGKYKEAISVFENLIEIEKAQRESYFTPFAEIYIEKSKARMRDMLMLEDKRWARMKEDVIREAQKIAEETAEKSAGEEQERILKEEETRRRVKEQVEKKRAQELEDKIRTIFRQGVEYYKQGNYPSAIVELKKIKELAPNHDLVTKAGYYIDSAQQEIKRLEEKELLARMEAARQAQVELAREQKRQERKKQRERLERERKEKEKVRLKKIFEARLKAFKLKQRIARIEEFMDKIRRHVNVGEFEEAEDVLAEAIAEFPRNKKFRDIAHYIKIQKIRLEEDALEKAREITEEKMLLEVAKKHMIPEIKYGRLERKKITPLVKVPEIRKRLKIPISVDFEDVELDYVLEFLSDATGVNIIPSSEIDLKEKKVTIKIKDMPLEDALRYILKSQELVYRLEEDAVWVTTEEELKNEQIETRVYFLNQGLGRFAEFNSTTSEGGEGVTTEVKTVKDILENAVDWPKDSKLTLDDRTGALIISNIPSNLEIIENLLYNLDVTPIQVLIEARFMEITVTDITELGIEWQLNSNWGVKQNNAKQNEHGFVSGSGVDFSDFSNKDYGFNLTYQGILSHPQFQAVMHALKQKENVKTLSAPRITTLNNQTASIEVIDEYIYPTRYEVSLVQYDINGDGDFDDAGETEWANIPQDFVTRDVGILLHVKPSVGVDNKTITLSLTPEVSEQDTTTSSFSYSGDVSIPNFKTRNLSTSVILESGETVVMGGLIKETNTDTKTKVPVLGDLPIIGSLFRRNYENVERRNLLIFVTATVLNKPQSVMVNVPEQEPFKREQGKVR